MTQFIRLIFSDLTHIILTSVIDVLLYYFVRKSLKAKTKMISSAFRLRTASNQLRLNAVKKSASKSSKRILRMILFNQLNFLLLRFPLAILSFYGYVLKYATELKRHQPDYFSYSMCKTKKLCVTVSEIFFYSYLTSFLTQFILFYKLVNNFNASFLNIKKRRAKRSANQNEINALN